MAVSKDEAVKKLQMKRGNSFQHPDGAFIVRPSEKNADDLSLTVRYCVSSVTVGVKFELSESLQVPMPVGKLLTALEYFRSNFDFLESHGYHFGP